MGRLAHTIYCLLACQGVPEMDSHCPAAFLYSVCLYGSCLCQDRIRGWGMLGLREMVLWALPCPLCPHLADQGRACVPPCKLDRCGLLGAAQSSQLRYERGVCTQLTAEKTEAPQCK